MALVRTPLFWDRRGPLSDALLPLSLAYAAATYAVEALRPPPRRSQAPRLLRPPRSHTPHILTRGYGGSERGPLRVAPEVHSAARVGDEARLLSRTAPTWVCADRWAGASAACASATPPSVLLMDDGLQHPTLHRDLSLLVVDAEHLLGNEASPARTPSWRSLGCRLCGTLALPDHAPVPATALAQLRREAATEGALLVTTEKDAARLDEAELRGIEVLPLRLEWTDGAGEAIDAMIGGVVAARGQPLENGRYAG
ncbi:hypothetical protein EMIHUDRAFT_204242 [Emiliania huxleyi CCMP1516]|uniref:tetraacyldisaccharide 4'-kinase n=2 Tax=Emiliania huxleyi TaxID=2903 RepID=A0A0D3JY06_EMIH1|nr:hypothetical protein EMIHUDRAFT_204242 [Emiliania huxleyi CCMP1516]EOD28391.1 hypothetical protein EMIHUDRAFT_204242 [Emiliania huxleyi CCMP1516]|eukprot:XP_005780820.1 hypothetical protein EMIHUDRAFT_204242 [Emiliania huxleyi CCMP1516]